MRKIPALGVTNYTDLPLLMKQVDPMKKTKVFLLLFASLLLVDVPLETMASSADKTKADITAIGRKRKGYKAKRGGLFNTGLFRKKNSCGCPNH